MKLQISTAFLIVIVNLVFNQTIFAQPAKTAAEIDAAAQSSETKVLSVEEVRADLELLHKILTESHPNLYRGITKKEAEKNWRRTRLC